MEAVNLETVQKNAAASIDEVADELQAISLEIHAHPELALEEVRAHQVLCDYLEKKDLELKEIIK